MKNSNIWVKVIKRESDWKSCYVIYIVLEKHRLGLCSSVTQRCIRNNDTVPLHNALATSQNVAQHSTSKFIFTTRPKTVFKQKTPCRLLPDNHNHNINVCQRIIKFLISWYIFTGAYSVGKQQWRELVVGNSGFDVAAAAPTFLQHCGAPYSVTSHQYRGTV